MRFHFLVVLVIFGYQALSQPNKDYSKIDALAIRIPDSSQQTTDGIARYIEKNFTNPVEKSRAIFAWLAQHVEYDVANMYNINFNLSPSDVIKKTLSTRKAVCQGYAEIFHEVTGKLGIPTYLVEGYTRQNGMVDYLPHAWCAVYLDSVWAFVDPTWGAGNIQKGKYVKQLNNFYFKTPPEKLIASHIAFDPLFQFLYYPVTNQEFSEGKTNINEDKTYFNYQDTLKIYETLDAIQKLESRARRINANGVNNALVFDRLQYLSRELEYQRGKIVVDLYNSAVVDFNQAVAMLNRFIEYRNKQFTPSKTDPEIKHMIDTVDVLIAAARNKLSEIKKPDPANEAVINQMLNNMKEVQGNLEEQKAFLDKYFKTSKVFRKSLFYNYKRK
ncbi:MAG: transglutaminase domain-containing protein [Bacteroidales bacterium]